MIQLRQRKVDQIAEHIPLQAVTGPESGRLLVLSWGGTYGACATAVERCRRKGHSVAHAHLRYLYPFPRNLLDILNSYERVLVPELNLGQLRMLLRAKYLIDVRGLNKVKGRPFDVSEIMDAIEQHLE